MKVSAVENPSDHITEWNLLELKNSTDSYGADILLVTPEEMGSYCSEFCILVFEVFSQEGAADFTFTASRSLSILQEGTIYTESLLEDGNYKYYMFYKRCHDCPMKISLNPQGDAKAELMVNFNTTTNLPKLQNKEDVHFMKSFRSNTNKQLVIKSDSKYFKDHGITDTAGPYLIAVHSLQNATYAISVSLTHEDVSPVFSGIPHHEQLERGAVRYYTYKHYLATEFKVHAMTLYGMVEMFIKAAPIREVDQDMK